MSKFEFIKLTGDPVELDHVDQALEFADKIGAIFFKRCKTKNKQGHWQIACYDQNRVTRGFIICTNQKSRLTVFDALTHEFSHTPSLAANRIAKIGGV